MPSKSLWVVWLDGDIEISENVEQGCHPKNIAVHIIRVHDGHAVSSCVMVAEVEMSVRGIFNNIRHHWDPSTLEQWLDISGFPFLICHGHVNQRKISSCDVFQELLPLFAPLDSKAEQTRASIVTLKGNNVVFEL